MLALPCAFPINPGGLAHRGFYLLLSRLYSRFYLDVLGLGNFGSSCSMYQSFLFPLELMAWLSANPLGSVE
jgi:hypothetical protein